MAGRTGFSFLGGIRWRRAEHRTLSSTSGRCIAARVPILMFSRHSAKTSYNTAVGATAPWTQPASLQNANFPDAV